MPKRRTITARLARDVMIRQLAEGRVVRNDGSARIGCAICKLPISTCSETVWEHMHPLALGGADDETNIRLVHKHCAKEKTSGAGATTHGTDIGEIAKTKRLEKAREALDRGEARKPKKKIPNRGWNTRFRKKMDGTVEEREDVSES